MGDGVVLAGAVQGLRVHGVHHLELADDAVLAIACLDHEAKELIAAQRQGQLLIRAHMGGSGDAVRRLGHLQLGSVLGRQVTTGGLWDNEDGNIRNLSVMYFDGAGSYLWSTIGVGVDTDGQAGRKNQQTEHICLREN